MKYIAGPLKSQLTVAEAKQLISINDICLELGISSELGRSCKSPFREDRNPSFSVFERNGECFWKDHGTGESGDVIKFWAKAKGLDKRQACSEFMQFAKTKLGRI